MTQAPTGSSVRLRARASDDPRAAAATVTAEPGRLRLETPTRTRELVVGTDVHAAAFRPGPDGATGQVTLLDGAGQPVLALDVADWVPMTLRVSQALDCEPGDDELAWSGFRDLLTTAGLPVRPGAPTAPPEVTAGLAPDRRAAAVLSLLLGLTGFVWFAGFLYYAATESHALERAALGFALLLSLALVAQQAGTALRRRALPSGQVVEPRPSVPINNRFRRGARVVLTPAEGPLEAIAVRNSVGVLQWLDGPTSPLGVSLARVVTPPGAPHPERVELVDGRGRVLMRLPWDQWFGGDDAGLRMLADRGVVVEDVAGAAINEATQEMLFWPRTERYAGELLNLPGVLQPQGMLGLALALSVIPVAAGLAAPDGGPTILLGLAIGVLLLGPSIVGLARRGSLNRPRPPAP